jgi:SAM-dependent methyltransferase
MAVPQMGVLSLPPITFACPNCADPLDPALSCPNCGRTYAQRDGIYRFMLPEREQALAPFLAQYRRVRAQDGYRSPSADYYRSLPDAPPGDPQAATWRLRAATYHNLERRARLDPVPAGHGLFVLDLGAGNGWLSNRLSALGHPCVAVDWLDDEADGLGAARHYMTKFTCLQADFDHLPLTPGQFDLVVYNASLHYSRDIVASLRHGASMLRPGGRLAILDSPTFRSQASAEHMVVAQLGRHGQADGTSDTVRHGQGYLLTHAVRQAGIRAGLDLRYWPTRGDLGWALRRQWAGLKLRREPASFGLWLGVKI